jgi:hypothetical protein
MMEKLDDGGRVRQVYRCCCQICHSSAYEGLGDGLHLGALVKAVRVETERNEPNHSRIRTLLELQRVRDRLEAAGLVQGFNEIAWELPPDRR